MMLIRRFIASNQSFRRLPLWVQLWILLGLGGVNIAAFFLTEFPTGYWAAWATAFIIAVNAPMVLIQQGYGKILAIPHLMAWIPLWVFAASRLAGDISTAEQIYAVLLLTVNGISILFDLVDTRRWLGGDRGVA